MTLNIAINFFKNLNRQTQKKSELKIYKEFIDILSDLENKGLFDKEIQSIEAVLSNLELTLNTENNKKHYKRKLNKFKKYLKEEFSFITKGYYATLGISLGMCFGIPIGTAVFGTESGVSSGILFGMFIGFIIGRYKDTEAEKENRVLNTSSLI